MTGFLQSGFLKLQLFPGSIAEDVRSEIDEAEFKKWSITESDRTWIPLTLPQGPATSKLLQTIEAVRTQTLDRGCY